MAKRGSQPGKRKHGQQKTHKRIKGNRSHVKHHDEQLPYAAQVAARLEILAKRAGSKSALDKLLDVSNGTIASYTRKPYRVPGGEFMARIAEVTGCDPAWLLTGRGEPFPADYEDELARLRSLLLETSEELRKLAERLPRTVKEGNEDT